MNQQAIPETTHTAPTNNTNPFDTPETRPTNKIPYVTDGQIIDVENVIKKEDKTFEFKNNDGTTTKTDRKVLTFKDSTQLVIPNSLSWKISDLRREYGDKCKKVKVKITGVGQLKKYDALLVLE